MSPQILPDQSGARLEAPTKGTLLVVDDEPMIRSLLCTYLSDRGYACDSRASAESALAHPRLESFDLILSDLHMPGSGGLHLLQEVTRLHPTIAFLMVTAAPDTQIVVEAMRTGAADFLLKPLDLKRLLAAIEQALRRRNEKLGAMERNAQAEQLLRERSEQLSLALRQLKAASTETMRALAMALDLRAHDMADHSLRVSRYGMELATRLGYSPSALERFEQASYLHDIGKLGIPDAILNKPAALTPAELEVMRSHVQIGFDLVSQVQSLASAAELVLAHQEHYDGGGYPRGLAGEMIPRDARIFAVADALDAMTSDRPYRRALSWQHAHLEIVNQAGRQFDPEVVSVFVQVPQERWRELQAPTRDFAPPSAEARAAAASC